MLNKTVEIANENRKSQERELAFNSILFRVPINDVGSRLLPYLRDLNLDQIIEGVASLRKNYDLRPLLRTRLIDFDSILYRQEVSKDLESAAPREAVASLCESLRQCRQYVENADKGEYKFARSRQFLSAVDTYCEALKTFAEKTAPLPIASQGLRSFHRYVASLIQSREFRTLVADLSRVKSALGEIRYDLVIKDNGVTVRLFGNEPEYKPIIEKTFERFRRNAAKSYQVKLPEWGGMNHVEAQILERVALHFPAALADLESFWHTHADFLDLKIGRFESEVQLYLAYLEYIEPISLAGQKFCYPSFAIEDKEIDASETFDLALAKKIREQKVPVIANDFYLRGKERILVVSGPNHGGKTTFARMFGQVHYLATLGLPVPGAKARLLLFDEIFTHFEREEDITNLRGKLQDELVRVHEIFDHATSRSVLIMNEIFSSTTIRDSLFLSKKIMEKITRIDLVAVCVTFVDELSRFNDKTVSMVSAISPQNPAIRTFKVERRPADGLAYALAIAEKYHVTGEWLRKRVK